MRERRFLIPRSQWREGRAYLGPDETHHARRVLRLKPGDKVTVVDGEGGAFYGLLAEDAGGAPFCGELHPLAATGEPRDFITLAPALAKGDKLDVICEKAVECGVFALRPMLTAHCEPTPRAFANLRPRLEKIIQSALQQSGRARLPQLHDPVPLPALPLADYDAILILHPDGNPPALNDAARAVAPGRDAKILILCGPEGGFSPEEIAALTAQGAKPCGLGPRTLRTETAGPLAVFTALAARGNL